MDVVVGSGKHLLAMDRGGTSDPYVKCVQGQDKLFQTRVIAKSVNPVWGETFASFVDNPFKPICFQVYDKDLVGHDDFMGEAYLDLVDLNLRQTQDLALDLKDGDNEDLMKKNKKRKPLGSITLRITMSPMTKEQMNEVCAGSRF